MSKYLIVHQTTDGLGIEQLSVVRAFATRADAVKGARDLAPGTYSLLSELRASFIVRPSERVVQTVVDWGHTSQPRPRKVKAKSAKAPKAKSKANSTDTFIEEHLQ